VINTPALYSEGPSFICQPGDLRFSVVFLSLLANVETFLKLIEMGGVNVNFSLTTPSFDITHMRTHAHTQNGQTEIQHIQEAYLTNYKGLMTYLWITLCSKTIFFPIQYT